MFYAYGRWAIMTCDSIGSGSYYVKSGDTSKKFVSLCSVQQVTVPCQVCARRDGLAVEQQPGLHHGRGLLRRGLLGGPPRRPHRLHLGLGRGDQGGRHHRHLHLRLHLHQQAGGV